jgi:hypothetical protein
MFVLPIRERRIDVHMSPTRRGGLWALRGRGYVREGTEPLQAKIASAKGSTEECQPPYWQLGVLPHFQPADAEAAEGGREQNTFRAPWYPSQRPFRVRWHIVTLNFSCI